jgi:hypothetical protein
MATVTTVKTKDFQESAPLVDDGKGYWKSGAECSPACSCFTNCGICCAVCWCHPITTGQLYERMVVKGLLQKLPLLSCLSIALFLYFAEIFEYIVSIIYSAASKSSSSSDSDSWTWYPDSWYNATQASEPAALHLVTEPALKMYMLYENSDNSAGYGFLSAVAQGLSLAASLCICLIVCTVRSKIRKRDNIPPGGCGDCEDCCCACCCNPCTQCMLLRHELHGLKPGTNEQYQLCSKTASSSLV